MSWMAVAAVGSAVVGGVAASNSAKKTAQAQQEATDKSIEAQKEAQALDPRVTQLLYGDEAAPERRLKSGVTPIYSEPTGQKGTRTRLVPTGTDEFGNAQGWIPIQEEYDDTTARKLVNPDSDYETPAQDTGMLGRIRGLLDVPQNAATAKYNAGLDKYMSEQALGDMADIRATARHMQSGNVPANWMSSAKIEAPTQNNIDLANAYNNMIYGNSAENPYLTGALQGGIDQSSRAFGDMLSSATRNLTENVLPSIRSGAQVSGQYGGSRQALAEGSALGEFSRSIGKAATDYGNQNTAAILGAKANAYESGQNRALNAMSGLGGQQYATASQNAQFEQQGRLANLDSANRAMAQGAANMATGAGMLSGLSGGLISQQQNAQNADINRLGGVTGLLSPYLKTQNINVPQYQPVYNNAMSGAIGGATAGLGLMNAFKQPVSTNPGGFYDSYRFNGEY